MNSSSSETGEPLGLNVNSEPLDGGGTVIACGGELDIATGAPLREALDAAGSGDLVVDFTELSFIDSTGVSILLGVRRRLNEADRRFVVVCPSGGEPRRVFDLTGLEQVIEVFDTRAEALERLA